MKIKNLLCTTTTTKSYDHGVSSAVPGSTPWSINYFSGNMVPASLSRECVPCGSGWVLFQQVLKLCNRCAVYGAFWGMKVTSALPRPTHHELQREQQIAPTCVQGLKSQLHLALGLGSLSKMYVTRWGQMLLVCLRKSEAWTKTGLLYGHTTGERLDWLASWMA